MQMWRELGERLPQGNEPKYFFQSRRMTSIVSQEIPLSVYILQN